MKKCYVIMPYGGNDEAVQRHFAGVYHSIIVPAVTAAGYSVTRSDIAGEPGNITHDIIRDLADADIVIADLTTGNANVFFELGIRHAFRKSGTVHIIDTAHQLPFDVRQYRVVEYSTDLADIPDVIRLIGEAIAKREQQPNRPDNPVHDAIPELPVDARSVGDKALREQLKAAEEGLESARTECDQLAAKLAQLDPSGALTSPEDDVDVSALLDTADQVMATTGRHAILRLTEAMEKRGVEAFAKELRGVLQSPYLDQNDFAEINVLCKKAGLEGHRRATLEVARSRYPYSESMLLHFIDALDDSPDRRDQERGRLMLENRLGIEFRESKPFFTDRPPSLPLQQSLLLLFNFYMRAGKYDWVISLAEQVPEAVRKDVPILRNKARAYARMNLPQDAQRIYQQAMALDPADDMTLIWYADFLDDQGKSAEAYEECEKALLADPDDPDLYLHMAVQVFNRGYHRAHSGLIEGPLPRKSRASVAVPFVLKAIELRSDSLEEPVRILVRGGAVEAAHAIASGNLPDGEFETAALDYVIARVDSRAVQRAKGPSVSTVSDT